jgi:hypothetical protein
LNECHGHQEGGGGHLSPEILEKNKIERKRIFQILIAQIKIVLKCDICDDP